MTSRRWTAPRPINVYVIEHSTGLVLFDTGQDRASVTSDDYFPRGPVGWLYRRLARFDIGADDTLTASLAAIGYDIADVHTAIVSHLHQDHIGGLPELGHARIIVSAAERASVGAPGALLNGVMRAHIDLPGLRWEEVTPVEVDDPALAPFTYAHDIFGDGSLLLLPTPGHTPGSLSLLIRQQGMPELLCVGDLTYDVELLADEHVPGLGNRSRVIDSTRLVNEYARRHPNLVVLPAHDPASAAALNTARSQVR
ncbi:MBL fold metallo-hydrolase [Glaciihabitans sp. dw_435]|uniref:MBL fold metallo-hydrolase n=1 Tax=Glaciihabitans sp. dw_435 TaxID=2720081 RepID=UPI001BD4928A|nr:MBL fold metallo-hydrolase [Glaciihabitans sp. dw_435]